MPARPPKVKVTVSVDGQLILKAKLVALRRSVAEGRTITLEELIEAGLRKELRGGPDRPLHRTN
jgi:hypothetical protein